MGHIGRTNAVYCIEIETIFQTQMYIEAVNKLYKAIYVWGSRHKCIYVFSLGFKIEMDGIFRNEN